jgi:hypothetical protein
MRTELAGPGVTAAGALSAVEDVLPAFELLDFIYSGTPRAGDYIANSIHGQAVVLGPPIALQGLDLAPEGVDVEHNGEIVGTYTAAEVMGNPLNALAWLANQLTSRGQSLKRGDIVISGGISKLLRPKVGDSILARFASWLCRHQGRVVTFGTASGYPPKLTVKADVRHRRLGADIVVKVGNCLVIIFPRVYGQAMRSPTSLHERRVYGPENFWSPVQKDFCNNICQQRS